MSHTLRIIASTSALLALAACIGLGGNLAARAAGGTDRLPGPAAVESIAARQAVAHEVIEGRLALSGAVERFRAISQARGEFSWQALRATCPGATDDECLGRQVIVYAAEELRDHPEHAQELVARLNADLAASGLASKAPAG